MRKWTHHSQAKPPTLASAELKQFSEQFLRGEAAQPSQSALPRVSASVSKRPVRTVSTSPRTLPSIRSVADKSKSPPRPHKDAAEEAIPQRSQYPISLQREQDDAKTSARTRSTQLRAEVLFDRFYEHQKHQKETLAEHRSMDAHADDYDAFAGAEKAVLYIPRTIGDDDFRTIAKATDFDSKFVEIMTLFTSKDIRSMVRDGSDSVDTEALAYLSKATFDSQGEHLDGHEKKKLLYQSFRVAHRGLTEDSDESDVGPHLVSDGSDSDLDSVHM